MDLSGLMNPKRVIQRRENESDDEFQRRLKKSTLLEEDGVVVSAPSEKKVRFGKGYSEEERADQQRKLAEVLKRRK